jgi:hypothetical protein
LRTIDSDGQCRHNESALFTASTTNGRVAVSDRVDAKDSSDFLGVVSARA